MAFLVKEDFKTVIREYKLNSITDGDEDIITAAINAAIEEASSLLTRNDKKKYDDGRPTYDVAAIFTAEGGSRNALILANTKSLAVWRLVELCNTGYEYEKALSRYDRAVSSLKELADGDMNSPTLPRVTTPPPADKQPFASGSNRKFNHFY